MTYSIPSIDSPVAQTLNIKFHREARTPPLNRHKIKFMQTLVGEQATWCINSKNFHYLQYADCLSAGMQKITDHAREK